MWSLFLFLRLADGAVNHSWSFASDHIVWRVLLPVLSSELLLLCALPMLSSNLLLSRRWYLFFVLLTLEYYILILTIRLFAYYTFILKVKVHPKKNSPIITL